MARAFILVLDSLGIGAAHDAARFGEQDADTLGHIARWRNTQGAPLQIPHLERLGLGAASHRATGRWPAGLARRDGFTGAFATAPADRRRDSTDGAVLGFDDVGDALDRLDDQAADAPQFVIVRHAGPPSTCRHPQHGHRLSRRC